MRLSRNLPVGADAHIGPLQMLRIRRKFEENTVLFCRGDEGIAPYDGVIPHFFDTLTAAPMMEAAVRLPRNLPVGADAHIGPLQMLRIRRKFEKNTVLFCRGDEGIAPYDGVIPHFFDTLTAAPMMEAAVFVSMPELFS